MALVGCILVLSSWFESRRTTGLHNPGAVAGASMFSFFRHGRALRSLTVFPNLGFDPNSWFDMVNECACPISAQDSSGDFNCVLRSGGRPCTHDRQDCTVVGGVNCIPYGCSLSQAGTCTWYGIGETCSASAAGYRCLTSGRRVLLLTVMACGLYIQHPQPHWLNDYFEYISTRRQPALRTRW